MIGKQLSLASRPVNLRLQLRIPPDVINIQGHARAFPQAVTNIQRLSHRVHTSPIGRVHGMQGLNGQRHLVRSGMFQHSTHAIEDLLTSPCNVTGSLRQTADHQHQAFGTQRHGFIDRTAIVVDIRLQSARIICGEHATPAQSGNTQPGIPDSPGGFVQSTSCDLVTPGRNGTNMMARATVNHLPEVPLLAHRRGIERQQ